MALELYIPPCILPTPHPFHLPPSEKPLRIQIEGPLSCMKKLLPEASWALGTWNWFPLPGGPGLARLTYQRLYGRDVRPDVANDMVVRDEYLGWVMEARPKYEIDYYGVTFDHLVPPDDTDPEVLQINIIEVDYDGGEYANTYNPFKIDPADYTGKKVLAVPCCCQYRKGTTDRERVNSSILFEHSRVAQNKQMEKLGMRR